MGSELFTQRPAAPLERRWRRLRFRARKPGFWEQMKLEERSWRRAVCRAGEKYHRGFPIRSFLTLIRDGVLFLSEQTPPSR